MEAMVQAGELDPAELPDCCNDMQTWAETGRLCKSGLDCAGLVVWAPSPAPMAVGTASAFAAPGMPVLRATSAPPGAPWRPPTAA